jgi:hypothetical protein
MGFSEDDRIRSKNKDQNEAYRLYEALQNLGYSYDDIMRYADFAMQDCSDQSRNNILNIMIRIARGQKNESSKTT